MRTTLSIKGMSEVVVEKAVEVGLARSKTDAIRLGILSLNKEYHLVKDVEMEMVARKLKQEEAEAKRKGTKFLSKEEAFAKYR